MKNIIFDFGNVLVGWKPEEFYTQYFKSQSKAQYFLNEICSPQWRNRIDAGESQDLCIEELSQEHPQYREAIQAYKSRWEEMFPGEIEGMREVVAMVKSNPEYRVYGLTNWSMETFPQARKRFGILQMIDHYIVSGNVGLVKPDIRIFELLLKTFDLQASESIFIDDNSDNVAAAKELGIDGVVFLSADQLRQVLQPLSVI